MNCPLCQAANEEGAYYCKNCRQPLAYYPPQGQPVNPYMPYTPMQPVSDRGVAALTIFLAWGGFITIGWFVLQKVIIANLYEDRDSSDWETIASIHKIASWAFSIGSLLVATGMAIWTRNKMARTILIVIGALDLVVTLLYRFLDS
jgi:hypothetical protein